jgi:hypothetical protein
VGPRFVLRVRLGSFAFVFYEFTRVSPGYLGDPYGYPRQQSTKIINLFFLSIFYG